MELNITSQNDIRLGCEREAKILIKIAKEKANKIQRKIFGSL